MIEYRSIDAFTGNFQQQTALVSYFPVIGSWQPKVNVNLITNPQVKKDFQEAVRCYNNDFFNASMVMARRALHQEMIERRLEEQYPNDLYKQIENSWIGVNLKKLLQKVKNFWNFGAHPDYCLFDNNGKKIEDEGGFAKLALDFLDKFFADMYEIDGLIENAPKNKHELKNNNS